jgi:gliding motility-associated-like protein
VQVNVQVTPLYDVYVPNVFSPNGDGNNDYFQVYGNKDAWEEFSIQIFDRWGEKVYESGDMNFQWDGSYRGEKLPVGVYVYEFNVVYINSHPDKLYTGSITLLR